MSRIANYKKCWDCGAEAGIDCIGEDGKPALEVCDGRRLHVGDFADRLELVRREKRLGQHSRRDAPPDPRPQALDDPLFAACQHCRTPVRLWGAAVTTGRTWCSAVECRRAYDRQRPRVRKKPRKCRVCKAAVPGEHPRGPVTCEGCRPVAPTLPCHWCGTVVSARGRAKNERACCGATACVEARRVGYRPRRPEAPCAHCGTSTPLAKTHRRHGLPACSAECSQEITRARERSRPPRRPKAADPAQQQHA